MIKSMTGFGKSSLINEQREYQMEIKSVNHRYLDISVKMPRQLSYLEETIKKEISSKVKRGKIEVYIRASKSIYRTIKRTSYRNRNIYRNKCTRNSKFTRCI